MMQSGIWETHTQKKKQSQVHKQKNSPNSESDAQHRNTLAHQLHGVTGLLAFFYRGHLRSFDKLKLRKGIRNGSSISSQSLA